MSSEQGWDEWERVLYSRDQHDELVAPLLQLIETIPSVVRDAEGKVKAWTPTIAALGGSYPETIVRFAARSETKHEWARQVGSIVLRLRLQDDGFKPYVIGTLKKFGEWRRTKNGHIKSSAIECITIEVMYSDDLARLPELIAKLERAEVPSLLKD
jgi:hypothetical protein